MTPVRCADASLAAGEALGGTGMVATRWLLVESRQPWQRDAVASGFPEEVSAWLATVDAEVLAIRRPGHTGSLTVFAAETGEGVSTLRRLELRSLDELPALDPWADGDRHPGPLFLVCTHGRRDACCSRLGIPVYHGLEAMAGPDVVWQCSHTGGHRFAANVIVLPQGVTLGRVEPHEVPELVALIREGRVPLGRYRGRSVYDSPVQAAEVALRLARGLDRLDDVRLVRVEGERVELEAGDGTHVEARVVERPGPLIPKSCGADPEQLTTFEVQLG